MSCALEGVKVPWQLEIHIGIANNMNIGMWNE